MEKGMKNEKEDIAADLALISTMMDTRGHLCLEVAQALSNVSPVVSNAIGQTNILKSIEDSVKLLNDADKNVNDEQLDEEIDMLNEKLTAIENKGKILDNIVSSLKLLMDAVLNAMNKQLDEESDKLKEKLIALHNKGKMVEKIDKLKERLPALENKAMDLMNCLKRFFQAGSPSDEEIQKLVYEVEMLIKEKKKKEDEHEGFVFKKV